MLAVLLVLVLVLEYIPVRVRASVTVTGIAFVVGVDVEHVIVGVAVVLLLLLSVLLLLLMMLVLLMLLLREHLSAHGMPFAVNPRSLQAGRVRKRKAHRYAASEEDSACKSHDEHNVERMTFAIHQRITTRERALN